MTPTRGRALAALALLSACGPGSSDAPTADTAGPATVRIALFNVKELRTEKILETDAEGRGSHPQALAAARILRRIAPDVIVLNEIDHDYDAIDQGLDLNAKRFRDLYLSDGDDGLELPFSYAAPNNTGILSGLDLDGDGHVATDADRGERAHGGDCWGYGTYPGEYSMAVLSRFPILADQARTFQKLLWKDLPGHHLPEEGLAPAAAAAMRLSSKSHWDLPIDVGDGVLHLFASHPTPQGFDGPEDKNGRRNFDEIKLWVEYLDGDALVDDDGSTGGYGSDDPFVVIGDLNAKPLVAGEEGTGSFQTSVYDGKAAIDQLLDHPRIQDSGPATTSPAALLHNTDTPRDPGPPHFYERSTSVFGDGSRIDYILPSTGLEIVDGGVFWPTEEEDPEGARWAADASDHRLVWLDLSF